MYQIKMRADGISIQNHDLRYVIFVNKYSTKFQLCCALRRSCCGVTHVFLTSLWIPSKNSVASQIPITSWTKTTSRIFGTKRKSFIASKMILWRSKESGASSSFHEAFIFVIVSVNSWQILALFNDGLCSITIHLLKSISLLMIITLLICYHF